MLPETQPTAAIGAGSTACRDGGSLAGKLSIAASSTASCGAWVDLFR